MRKEQFREEIDEKFRKEDEELIAKAKLPEELIVEIYGEVTSVKSYTTPMSHTLDSEIVIGQSSPVYDTGYQSRLEIGVQLQSPLNSSTKRLIFNGISPIRAGDFVRAGIFAGKKEELHFTEKHQDPKIVREGITGFDIITDNVFLERELQEEEEALYLILISEGRPKVRTDYGVNYKGKD